MRSSQDSMRPATWLETGASKRHLERDNSRCSHYVRKTNGAHSSFVSTVLHTSACSFSGLARRQPGALVSAAHALAYGHHDKAAKLRRKHMRYATRGSEGRGKQSKRIIAERRVSRTLAHDSSRARATIPGTTRSSVSAGAASVRVLRPSPRLYCDLSSPGSQRRAQTLSQ